jgi:hypothetical protein
MIAVFTSIIMIGSIAFMRIYVRSKVPFALDSDTYFHLALAKKIKDSEHTFEKEVPQLVLPGEIDYPYFFHYLYSFVPHRFFPTVEKMISTFLDFIHSLVFLVFLYIDPLQLKLSQLQIVLLVLLHATNPNFLSKQVGPRAYQATPRVMSELLYFLHFISLSIFFQTSYWIWFAVSVIWGSLLLITSKFGGQVIFLFSIVLFFVTQDYYVLLSFLCSIIGAIVISKGYYFQEVLKGQLSHLSIYRTHLVKVHPQFKRKTTGYDQKCDVVNPVSWLRSIKHNSMIGKFIYIFPIICLSLFACWKGYNLVENEIVLGVFVSGLVISTITTTKPLMFIGEGIRYLDYSLVALYLYIVLYVRVEVLGLLLIYQVFLAGYSACMYLKYHKNSTSNYQNYTKPLFDLITNNYPEKVVFPITNGAPWRFWYELKNPIVFNASINRKYWPGEMYKKTFPEYPHIAPKLFQEHVIKYDVGLVVVHKSTFMGVEERLGKYDFKGFHNVWENKYYLLKAKQGV